MCSVPGRVWGDKHSSQTGRGNGAVKPGFNLHQAGGLDGVNQAGLQGAKALGCVAGAQRAGAVVSCSITFGVLVSNNESRYYSNHDSKL